MNPIAIQLLNQQLISPQLSTPAEVVRYMGAMQAQAPFYAGHNRKGNADMTNCL